MQAQSTNLAVDGPGTSAGSQRQHLRWPTWSLLVSFVLVTTVLTGALWFFRGVEGAILGGCICALAMIFLAAKQFLLPVPASHGPKKTEKSLDKAAESQRHPNERWPRRVLQRIIRAEAGMVLELVSRATGRRRSAVVAGAMVGAATGGCFGVVIHTLPEPLRLRAIQDAVTGAATFALVGAMLGARGSSGGIISQEVRDKIR
jgi:hypothetical protein